MEHGGMLTAWIMDDGEKRKQLLNRVGDFQQALPAETGNALDKRRKPYIIY